MTDTTLLESDISENMSFSGQISLIDQDCGITS